MVSGELGDIGEGLGLSIESRREKKKSRNEWESLEILTLMNLSGPNHTIKRYQEHSTRIYYI